MADDPLFIVTALACLVVAGILMFGILSFGKGGDFNHKHANRIMRWRLIAQFVAVLLILAFVWYHQQGGS